MGCEQCVCYKCKYKESSIESGCYICIQSDNEFEVCENFATYCSEYEKLN